MWDVYVGQKVVCIVDDWPEAGDKPRGKVPRKDATYTVRDVAEYPHPGLPGGRGIGLRLCEIVNPPNNYADGYGEVAFDKDAFRPVLERKTDISVFTRMLHPEREVLTIDTD